MRIHQMFIKNKYNSSTLYTLTWDTGQDHIGSYIVKDVSLHKPENIKNWDLITQAAHLYVAFTAVWTVLVNICNLEL
jgi:hypothetical protein